MSCEVKIEMGGPGGGWFVLVTVPGREAKAVAFLERQGVMAWVPMVERWRRLPGGQRRAARMHPVMPGYVFARFSGAPHWRALFGMEPGCFFLRGVLGRDGAPAALSPDQLREVARVFDRLEKLWRAPEPDRVRAGDQVRVRGAADGWVMPVAEVRGPLAWVLMPMLGGRRAVEVPVASLDRV